MKLSVSSVLIQVIFFASSTLTSTEAFWLKNVCGRHRDCATIACSDTNTCPADGQPCGPLGSKMCRSKSEDSSCLVCVSESDGPTGTCTTEADCDCG